jgi:hypothetical protein
MNKNEDERKMDFFKMSNNKKTNATGFYTKYKYMQKLKTKNNNKK